LIANVLLGIGVFIAVCGWRALDFTNTNLMISSSASSGFARFDKAYIYLGGVALPLYDLLSYPSNPRCGMRCSRNTATYSSWAILLIFTKT
jgi:hypothetical protein